MWRKIFYNLLYLGQPRWDTGLSPPELNEFIDQHQPGRALDLGCGTGTNVIMLAKHGWQANGVDFTPRAIAKARWKARQAAVQVNLRVADVSMPLPLDPPFDLILDIGCLHSLPVSIRPGYYSNLFRLLEEGGYYLLYAFTRTDDEQPGLSPKEIQYLSERINLLSRHDGKDTAVGRRSSWFTYQGKRQTYR